MANENLNKTKSESQCKRIAEWLNKGKSITQLEALHLFGCFRLASRIHDLRERGMNIVMEKIVTPTGKYVASYKLAKS